MYNLGLTPISSIRTNISGTDAFFEDEAGSYKVKVTESGFYKFDKG
jgi:hypothetical protein